MIDDFFECLLSWYAHSGRHHLPWREYDHPLHLLSYRVYVSEVLLQQTQASRAQGYFERICRDFPDIESLAQCSWEDFFPYYDGLGYYSRGKNMLRAAERIVQVFGGLFPSESDALCALPGVGPYTAEAIRSFAFGIPTLAWDTNVEQIMRRLIHGSRHVMLSGEEILDIKQIVASGKYPSRDINNALMDYGSMTNKKSYTEVVALGLDFGVGRWSTEGGVHELMIDRKRRNFPTQDARIRAIVHEDHREYLCPPDGIYWEIDPIASTGHADIRGAVKAFFLLRYGVAVSVRPVHHRYYEHDVPHVDVYVQVQQGVLRARHLSRTDFRSHVNFVGK